MCLVSPGLRCLNHLQQNLQTATSAYEAAPTEKKKKRILKWQEELKLTPERIAETRLAADNYEARGDSKKADHLRAQADAREAIGTERNLRAQANMDSRIRGDNGGKARLAGSTTKAERITIAGTTADEAHAAYLANTERSIGVLKALATNPNISAETQAVAQGKIATMAERGAHNRATAKQKTVAPTVDMVGTAETVEHEVEAQVESQGEKIDRAREDISVQEQLALVREHSVEVRMALADSSYATPQILKMLAGDRNASVARYARNNRHNI